MPGARLFVVTHARRHAGGRKKRITLVAALSVALFIQQWPTPDASAMPLRYTIADLARMSDIVVIAQVESVRRVRFSGKRCATARVTQVWKGGQVDKIKFLVSSRDRCDISNAKRGEIALLFLTKELKSLRKIENSGRGRMPLCLIAGKQYVRFLDVAFPSGTRVVRLEDIDSEFNGAVEIDAVRSMVDGAIFHRPRSEPSSSAVSPRSICPASVPEVGR
jgi:hypothetical protein